MKLIDRSVTLHQIKSLVASVVLKMAHDISGPRDQNKHVHPKKQRERQRDAMCSEATFITVSP